MAITHEEQFAKLHEKIKSVEDAFASKFKELESKFTAKPAPVVPVATEPAK